MEQNVFEAGQQNFTLPHDVVTLPTKGVFYKSKKKSIKVGYLTANDENYLLNSNRSGRENVVIGLLRNKIYEHDLRPDELLEPDVEAILIFLRNTSFGPEYNVSLLDPQTNKYFTHTEILDSLNLKRTEYEPSEDGTYTVKLPKTQVTVQLKPLTFNEVTDIDKMAEEYPVGLVAPRITWRLNKQILSIDGNSDKGYIAKFVEELPIMDSKFIRNFMRDNLPSLDLTRTVIAPSGEKVTFDVTFGAEFFRPFF